MKAHGIGKSNPVGPVGSVYLVTPTVFLAVTALGGISLATGHT